MKKLECHINDTRSDIIKRELDRFDKNQEAFQVSLYTHPSNNKIFLRQEQREWKKLEKEKSKRHNIGFHF